MKQHDQSSFARVLASLALLALLASAVARPARAACLGDCNGDCQVTVNEIITIVNIVLGNLDISVCPRGSLPDIPVISDIIQVINNALLGCPAGSCPSACGNGRVDGGEDCDDGGTCIGGSNAGSSCTADTQCSGDGVCDDGSHLGYACAADGDCPDARCVRCKTFGGDGCAANCTMETDIDFPLVSGVPTTSGTSDLMPGTSGAVIHGDILTIPLPFSGSEKLTVGKLGSDGTVPFVIKAANVSIPKIEVSTLGEACVRAVALETCGGTVFEADGSESPSCGLGFIEADCPPDKPCTSAYGPGNSASGVLACGGAGLPGIDVNVSQDAGGTGLPGPILRTVSGTGPAGSARLLNSVSITSQVGIDPEFCRDGEPVVPFGQVSTSLLTTGTACCELQNINGEEGTNSGPFCSSGTPFNCSALNGAPLTGGVAGAAPLLGQPTVGDICTTSQLFTRPQ
jgi:hypothetical protein